MRLLPMRRAEAPPGAAQRSQSWPDSSRPPTWSEISIGQGYTPMNVTPQTAYGLPAVGAAIRLVAETIASLPLVVYSGFDADKRRARDTWQYQLLHELPGMGDFTPFDFIADVAAGVEASGNAFVQKIKAGGQVVALIVIDPCRVEVKREAGAKLFLVRDAHGRQQAYTAADILHVRGFTMTGSDMGLSPVAVHRRKLGAVMARDEFEGRFFGQGTNFGVAIEMPGNPSDDDKRSFLRRWVRNHSGLPNAHLPVLLTDGAKVSKLGMNLNDAQYVESEKLNIVQVANIFRLPASWLGGDIPSRLATAEQEMIKLYLSLLPRIRRIEMCFRSDPDLFPDRALYPQFDTTELIRTDAKTAAEVEHYQIQDGTLLKDEARARRGQGPLPRIPDDPTLQPGMVPLMTPTGAAPNPTASVPAEPPA